jgi:colanic acid/amylovoran biosynthesis glycosyltransferase
MSNARMSDAPLPSPFDSRPVAAIFRSPVFNASETFVQSHALALDRYQPLIVGLEARGHEAAELADRIVLPTLVQQLALKLLGRSRAFESRLRPLRPVLVHAHFGPDGLVALPIARALGIPLVTTLHGYDVSRSPAAMLLSGRLTWTRYQLLKRRLIAGGDLFLAVSDAVRARALDRGYPPERTIVHHNGVDLARFRGRAGAPEPGLILHVGRLVEKKGTALLLEAFARVRAARADAFLAIAGDGPLRLRLEAQSAGLGLDGAVRFLGALPHHETAAWMRRAWVLAAPSLAAADGDAEGLPQVVVEAAASSLPVVGSDHSGIPEAVVDGGTGFIVPQGESAPLAERLTAILDDADLRLRMGAAGRALAETRFDSVRQIARLESLYDSLLAGRRQTSP